MENNFNLINPLQSVNDANQIEVLFQKGLQAYQEKDYFSAHDHWEELWSDFYLKDRLFIQALIQMAVSFVHLENGNLNGAKSLLKKSLSKLGEFSGIHRNINTDVLIMKLLCVQDQYNLLETASKFDWDLVPVLE